MTELLPCPFCDGQAIITGRQISCGNEHCIMTSVSVKADSLACATECWNTRMTTPDVPPIALAGEPVAWITTEQLAQLTDLTADAWVYWREAGHVAEADEIPLCVAAPSPSASSVPVAFDSHEVDHGTHIEHVPHYVAPEPVAYLSTDPKLWGGCRIKKQGTFTVPVYAAPPASNESQK